MRKNNEHGLSYEDYLQVLILPVSKEKKSDESYGYDRRCDKKERQGKFFIWIPVL